MPQKLPWIVVMVLALVFAGALVAMQFMQPDIRVAGSTSTGSTSEGIFTNGQGKAVAPPDRAEVSVGIEVRAEKATDASGKANTIAANILAAVKRAGVQEQDVQTVDVSLYPEMDFSENGNGRVSGYVANNTVRITTRDANAVGSVIDAALAAGATTVNSVSFSFSDEKRAELEDLARKEAVQDALRRATVLSQLSGVRLGAPIAINESFTTPGPQPLYFAEDAGVTTGGGPTPVEGGTLEIVSDVSVTFGIE